jgi:hypothetical protein
MFDSRFGNGKVVDEPVYKSEQSINGSDLIGSIELFASINDGVVANSTTETTIINSINGTKTIPADTLEIGDIILTEVWGSYIKLIPANQNIIHKIRFGGYVGVSLVINHNPLTPVGGHRFRFVHAFRMEDLAGNPAPYVQYIQYLDNDGQQSVQPSGGIVVAPFLYDNTIDNDIDCTVQLSTADPQFSVSSSVRSTLIKG